MQIQIGDYWASRQNDHRGWTVRILKTSPNHVHFECVKGPGRSRKSRRRLGVETFLIGYMPSSAVAIASPQTAHR